MHSFYYVILIFAAFAGFLLSFYIRHKKSGHEKLVCPVGASCDFVIHSPYSRFFGLPVEVVGLFYYGLVALAYASFLVFPNLVSPPLIFLTLLATAAAFLFSLYLTFIQAFALKQWCTWCLASAGLCTLIFFTVFFNFEYSLVDLLGKYHEIIVIFHLLGVALGVGGATITDIFFFKFLKDFRISEWEADVMHTFSQVIWFALALLVVTGLGLYLPEAAELNQSAKFLVKMIVVAVIIANGAVLNLLVAPKLMRISFGEAHEHKSGELHHERKIAFASGAVSIVSWYSAFLLGMLRSVPFSFGVLLAIYLTVLLLSVAGSQILERSYAKRAQRP